MLFCQQVKHAGLGLLHFDECQKQFSRRVNTFTKTLPFQKPINFNFKLYSFIHTCNLQFPDSCHLRIEEPNRGGGRDTNLKKGRKDNILQTVPAVVKQELYKRG